ncbi:MAG: hypothetical protein ABL995_01695 [Bryobacteraceae bacterium]
MSHLNEQELARYATGETNWWNGLSQRIHLRGCDGCRRIVREYRLDRERLRMLADELPAGVSWDRLAAEMTANIRVGLAAGECVAPREKHASIPTGWRVAGAAAGFAVLLVAAWWLNMPKGETAALGRVMKAIVQPVRRGILNDEGTLVEASASGIEVRENGGRLGVFRQGVRPATVSLSLQGTARARYVDSDTGQVTITSVYAQ